MANKTIEQLKAEAAVVRDATEEKENTALRIGTVLIDMIDTLSESVSINAIKGFVVIDSTSELPENPTPEQQQKGYLLDTTLYVYVGEGGDTLEGKYRSAELKGADGAPGAPGPKGDSGVHLGDVALVNNLKTGGEGGALTAEMGKELAEMVTPRSSLSGKWRQGSLTAGHYLTSSLNTRIIASFPSSRPISFTVNAGYYVSIAFFSRIYIDAILNTTGAGWISNDSVAWRDGDVYLEPPVGCKDYFIIIKKGSAGTDNISPSEGATAITDIIENTPILDVLAEKEDRISDIEEGELNELFIGKLVQMGLSSNALVASDKYVSMLSKIVVPKDEATLRFKLPMRVCASVVSGSRPDKLSHNNYWFYDGDTFTLPKGDNYFRLGFGMVGKNGSGANVLLDNLTLADAEAYVNSGELKIYVDAEKPAQIVERNISSEKYVKAMMRPFVAGYANNGDLHSLPLLAHTSDTHSDANRLRNFAAYCDYLQVDGALLSGDMAALTVAADSAEYVNDIADECTTMILPCIGNHDARNLSTDEAQNALLSHLITKYELVTNPQVTYPTYFYKDIAAKKVRIISLNIYENSHSSDNCHFSQQQCEWFIATLASTPANYGVLVMFHAPEVKPSKDDSHSAFYQDIINAEGYQSGLTGNVFRNIIDTFIERGTATISYTSKGTSISVSADFSSVALGVEFIAYVNGHLHIDLVGYMPNARNLQLNLNVTTTNAAYAPTSYNGMANPSDLPRGCEGVTQDSFNIYAIDRVAKTVRIARVGSNIAGNLTERKYMVIPYAD